MEIGDVASINSLCIDGCSEYCTEPEDALSSPSYSSSSFPSLATATTHRTTTISTVDGASTTSCTIETSAPQTHTSEWSNQQREPELGQYCDDCMDLCHNSSRIRNYHSFNLLRRETQWQSLAEAAVPCYKSSRWLTYPTEKVTAKSGTNLTSCDSKTCSQNDEPQIFPSRVPSLTLEGFSKKNKKEVLFAISVPYIYLKLSIAFGHIYTE